MNISVFHPLRIVAFAVGSLFLFTNTVQSHESSSVNGQFYFGPGIDARQEEQERLFLHITGAAAKGMYQRLDVKPVADLCLDNGSLFKQLGNLHCNYLPIRQQYDCYFSVNLTMGTLGLGSVC